MYTWGRPLQTVHDGTWGVANTRTFMDIEYLLEHTKLVDDLFFVKCITHTRTCISHMP